MLSDLHLSAENTQREPSQTNNTKRSTFFIKQLSNINYLCWKKYLNLYFQSF